MQHIRIYHNYITYIRACKCKCKKIYMKIKKIHTHLL